MAPKKDKSPPSDPNGIFCSMVVFLIEAGVQSRRLQIWKQKLVQMGAKLEDRFSKNVTHVFAMDANLLLQKLDKERLIRAKVKLLAYQWLEDSLIEGEKASEDLYVLSLQSGGGESLSPKADNDSHSRVTLKKNRISAEDVKNSSPRHMNDNKDRVDSRDTKSASSLASRSSSPEVTSPEAIDSLNKPVGTSDSSSLYKPPDLNRNITQIFGKLLNIYRGKISFNMIYFCSFSLTNAFELKV
ncbi:hypothetical protein AABB24_009270 [Solanum stoloniferum]|uniref:BRCT domain-containing protein n=1 Tax=Solanum stoloniferum TaxID=62892 RepID=A0ABD2UI56_9SOLN